MTKHENQFESISADPIMPKITFWVGDGALYFELSEYAIKGCAEALNDRSSAVRCSEKDDHCFSFRLNHQSSLRDNPDAFTNEVVEIVSGLIWSRVRRVRLREREGSEPEEPSSLATLRAKVGRYELALRKVANWREDCHALDEDNGDAPREFNSEAWDMIESFAEEVLEP